MKSTTEPFKATISLLDGRINSADGLIFLDALLYHGWFAKYAPDVLDGTKCEAEYRGYFGLPLRQLPDNRYAASCAFYDQHETNVEYWVKHPNFMDAAYEGYFDNGKAAKVNTQSGGERAYRMPCIVRLVGDLVFYGYGTINKVDELLSMVAAVGKKPAMGWGVIRDYNIEPIAEDKTTWTEERGLMRPMPIEEYTGADKARYEVRDCGIRPPYWKSKNQRVCYVPEVAHEAARG